MGVVAVVGGTVVVVVVDGSVVEVVGGAVVLVVLVVLVVVEVVDVVVEVVVGDLVRDFVVVLVVVGAEVLVGAGAMFATGGAAKSFITGEFPTRAESNPGSFPSIPSDQIPTPRVPKLLASCDLMASEVGSSNHVWCHWLPTLNANHAVLVRLFQ